MEITPKTTEMMSYTASSITFLDSLSTELINTTIAIIGVIGTLAINFYFTYRDDKRKEEAHRIFTEEHRGNDNIKQPNAKD